ncbi:methyltransferase-like protein 9 [Lytechinus variegatus]|uniref:methyltransferase-like protein 9 n=1 Tax=Lytechinus variegatus TaxID=7654 RepID=UPI001BB15826|nr:methyltransferase-like protein 9 [Lytechinus variegatus]
MASHRIRNPLLRAIHEHNTDERFRRSNLRKYYDVEAWYSCDTSKLPDWLASKFVQSNLDQRTEAFLDGCYEKSGWMLTQMWHSLAKSALSFFMSTTSVNGLLKRGSMFVFSRDQIQHLLGVTADWKAEKVIDLGAGDGEVTKEVDFMFKEVYATEASWTMQWRLSQQGCKVLPIDGWSLEKTGHAYDVISCLNLLDRCDQPLLLLKEMKESLSSSGVVIMAVVLPFKQFVEHGSNQNKPSEVIEIQGETWEEQVQHLVQEVIQPAGFQVRSFSRVPYLCEGDATEPFYHLNDALFVLERGEDAVDSQRELEMEAVPSSSLSIESER